METTEHSISESDQLSQLDKLYDEYDIDQRFNKLRHSGIKLVPGDGPLNPLVMLVGEKPGSMENDKAMPFIGRVGGILHAFLRELDIDPQTTFMTNVVKYWPENPHNEGRERTLTREEISVSREYLLREIAVVNPKLVGLCGLGAIKAIYPEATDVFSHNGEFLDDKFVLLYNPSLVLYKPWKRPLILKGFGKLKALMDKEKDKL